MELTFEPINGICFGFEYVPPGSLDDLEDDDEEYSVSTLLLDLVLVRVIIQW